MNIAKILMKSVIKYQKFFHSILSFIIHILGSHVSMHRHMELEFVLSITLSNEFKIKKKVEYDFLYTEDTTDCIPFMVTQSHTSLHNYISCKYFSSK